QVTQPVAEQKLLYIADEGVPGEIVAAADRRVPFQVARRAVQAQGVVRQLGAYVGSALRAFDGDGEVGFALGQAYETRHGQYIDGHMRIALLERRQQRREDVAAEAFRRADANVSRDG